MSPSSVALMMSCFTPFGSVSRYSRSTMWMPLVVGDIVAFRLTRAELAVDVELALAHLDAVAGQSDDALDVVGRVVARILEHRDIAAVRQAPEDASGERRPAERQRIARIAVAVFRDEQVVAHQQRGDHAAGGNVERLERDSAHHDGDQAGIDDRLDVLDPGARFAPGLRPWSPCGEGLPSKNPGGSSPGGDGVSSEPPGSAPGASATLDRGDQVAVLRRGRAARQRRPASDTARATPTAPGLRQVGG